MKSTLLYPILIASSVLSAPSFAHDNNCDIELNGHIQYYQGLLTVDMQNGTSFSIDDTHTLQINGETPALSKDQQQWVGNYYDNISTAIPMTLTIANEGLEVASIAVTEVFGELLGSSNKLTEDFDSMFVSLENKLNQSFYDHDGNIKIDSTQFDEPGWFDEQWEDEFEEQIESLMSRSMGRILMAVGSQMLWNDGDMTEFEDKMERFGESLETRIETQAHALEEKSAALCEVLKQADYAESKMEANISGLDGLNLLNIDSRQMKM